MNAAQHDISDIAEIPEQKRILSVLMAAQVLSGAGLAAGITVGALLAQQMLGTTSLAGLPSGLFTAGSALAAAGIGRLSQRSGRRAGLALGYGTGALGSLGVVAAAVTRSVPLLFVSLLVYGAGTATNLQARYAGADLAAPARRGRAVSRVLVATTVGGVIGPNLARSMNGLAAAWGIPPLAGPFVLAAAAYGSAGLLLGALLRPDPLKLARTLAERAPEPAASDAGAQAPPVRPAGIRAALPGAAVMALAQLVMVAIMTMTPVYMQSHGHGLAASGLVIAIHVGAMYLPSPLTGLLVDRFGRQRIAAASGAVLLTAGMLAALAPAHSVAALAAALALLGVGWNFGLVSGTAMITDAVPLASRAKTQGAVDVGIAIAGAVGGMGSGMVVAAAGYPALGITGGAAALVLLASVALMAFRRRAGAPAGAACEAVGAAAAEEGAG